MTELEKVHAADPRCKCCGIKTVLIAKHQAPGWSRDDRACALRVTAKKTINHADWTTTTELVTTTHVMCRRCSWERNALSMKRRMSGKRYALNAAYRHGKARLAA